MLELPYTVEIHGVTIEGKFTTNGRGIESFELPDGETVSAPIACGSFRLSDSGALLKEIVFRHLNSIRTMDQIAEARDCEAINGQF